MNHPPFIIPVFIPHLGCPHRCLFCNQNAISGVRAGDISIDGISRYIHEYLKYKGNKRGEVQISFYGGNFLGLDVNMIESLLDEAEKFIQQGLVNGIRFSTRPDTITEERLAIIRRFSVSTIELGIQSMIDRVLAASDRGHTSEDTRKAVQLIKTYDYTLGLQLMIGLPEETEADIYESAAQIIAMKPDFLRIYPTVVVENSPLAQRFKRGEYEPLSLEKAVSITKELFILFTRNGIKVIRMGLQATDAFSHGSALIAGPYHPSFGHMVYSKLFYDKALLLIQSKKADFKKVVFRVHPKSISKMRGLRNENLKRLNDRFHPEKIEIIADNSVSENDLRVDFI